MILVDTSVWIEFFRGKEPFFRELKELIENSQVVVHEVVFGELLQGCKNMDEVKFILKYWENLNSLTSNGSFLAAGQLSFRNQHIKKGIGLIDSVLLQAIQDQDLKLWTLDKKILQVVNRKMVYLAKTAP